MVFFSSYKRKSTLNSIVLCCGHLLIWPIDHPPSVLFIFMFCQLLRKGSIAFPTGDTFISIFLDNISLSSFIFHIKYVVLFIVLSCDSIGQRKKCILLQLSSMIQVFVCHMSTRCISCFHKIKFDKDVRKSVSIIQLKRRYFFC